MAVRIVRFSLDDSELGYQIVNWCLNNGISASLTPYTDPDEEITFNLLDAVYKTFKDKPYCAIKITFPDNGSYNYFKLVFDKLNINDKD